MRSSQIGKGPRLKAHAVCCDNVAVLYGKSNRRIQAAAVAARNLGATTSRSAYPSWGKKRRSNGLERFRIAEADLRRCCHRLPSIFDERSLMSCML